MPPIEPLKTNDVHSTSWFSEDAGACHWCLRDLLTLYCVKNMKKKLQPESPPALHTSDAKHCQITVIDLIPAVYCSAFSDGSPQEAQFVLYNCEKSRVMLVFPCHFLLAIASVFPGKTNGQWETLKFRIWRFAYFAY